MAENKDKLLQEQQDEIKKLKKELKEATKPSALFSVIKKAAKRNIHEFFNREDKMKSMNAEIKDLQKKLDEATEEKEKQEAIAFAAAAFQEEPEEKKVPAGEDIKDLNLPRTKDEAIKEYFSPLDFNKFAQQYKERKSEAVSNEASLFDFRLAPMPQIKNEAPKKPETPESKTSTPETPETSEPKTPKAPKAPEASKEVITTEAPKDDKETTPKKPKEDKETQQQSQKTQEAQKEKQLKKEQEIKVQPKKQKNEQPKKTPSKKGAPTAQKEANPKQKPASASSTVVSTAPAAQKPETNPNPEFDEIDEMKLPDIDNFEELYEDDDYDDDSLL